MPEAGGYTWDFHSTQDPKENPPAVEVRKKGTDWDAERREYIAMSFVTPKKIRNAVVTRLEPILERLSKENKVDSSEINALRVLLQSAKALEEGL